MSTAAERVEAAVAAADDGLISEIKTRLADALRLPGSAFHAHPQVAVMREALLCEQRRLAGVRRDAMEAERLKAIAVAKAATNDIGRGVRQHVIYEFAEDGVTLLSRRVASADESVLVAVVRDARGRGDKHWVSETARALARPARFARDRNVWTIVHTIETADKIVWSAAVNASSCAEDHIAMAADDVKTAAKQLWDAAGIGDRRQQRIEAAQNGHSMTAEMARRAGAFAQNRRIA